MLRLVLTWILMLWIPIRPDHAIVAVRLGVGRFFFISEIGQKPKYGAAANLSVRRPESIALRGPESIYTSRHIVSCCAKLQTSTTRHRIRDRISRTSTQRSTSLCFISVRNFKQTPELLHVCWIAGRSAEDDDDDGWLLNSRSDQ